MVVSLRIHIPCLLYAGNHSASAPAYSFMGPLTSYPTVVDPVPRYVSPKAIFYILIPEWVAGSLLSMHLAQ